MLKPFIDQSNGSRMSLKLDLDAIFGTCLNLSVAQSPKDI